MCDTQLTSKLTVMSRKMRETATNSASCGTKRGPDAAPETLRRISETSFVAIACGRSCGFMCNCTPCGSNACGRIGRISHSGGLDRLLLSGGCDGAHSRGKGPLVVESQWSAADDRSTSSAPGCKSTDGGALLCNMPQPQSRFDHKQYFF